MPTQCASAPAATWRPSRASTTTPTRSGSRARWTSNLHSVDLEPSVIRLLPKMIYHLDEPDADPAVFPSYLISKLAHENGTTVLLSGTGGDEVFFGYRSHRAYREYERFSVAASVPTEPPDEVRPMGPHPSIRRSARAGAAGDALSSRPPHERARAPPRPDRLVAARDTPEAGLQTARRQTSTSMTGPGCFQKYSDLFEGEGEINLHSHLLNQTFLLRPQLPVHGQIEHGGLLGGAGAIHGRGADAARCAHPGEHEASWRHDQVRAQAGNGAATPLRADSSAARQALAHRCASGSGETSASWSTSCYRRRP